MVDFIRVLRLLCILLPATLFLPRPALAQEDLTPILDRGYVAHWLVCGPFTSDVAGGILAAVRNESAVLGDTDFMAGFGGIARIRPDHLMRITTPDGGEAIWQRAGTTGPELDLKPFFPSSPSGVAYAAFYTVTARPATVFVDVQSPLGVRMWVNGFPVQDYAPAPLDEAGVTQVVVQLRAGNNLVVMEVPGADFEAIAGALAVTTQQLNASAMANRPRLRKTSGFALSTHLRSAMPLGKLFYVPNLEDAGTLSGGADNARQDTWLTLYNPTDAQSAPVDLVYSTPDTSLPELIEVEPLDAHATVRVPVPVPVQGLAGGTRVSVRVRMHSEGAEAAFNDSITVPGGAGQPGIVRVITGHTIHRAPGDPASASAAPYLNSVRHQLLFWKEASGYGFDLGHPSEWHRSYVAHPDLRRDLLIAAQQGAATVRAPYAPVDERIASGFLLWRNLQIGLRMNQGLLKSATPQYLAWNSPGIAPQTLQLLGHTPLDGLITNVAATGLPPLGRAWDLHGGSRFLRHKMADKGPATAEDVQEMAALQRRELLNLGIPSDVLIVDNVVPAPEPFYRGAVTNLARSFPRIVLDGGGGAPFFEEVAGLGEEVQVAIPPAAAYLNQGQPGDLLTWPMLKLAQARASRQQEAAETLATFASFQGAEYPHAAMDLANRQLAFYSTPDYLSAPATRDDVLDTLAGLREVADLSGEVLTQSLAYLAKQIDTAGAAPLNQGTFESIVVFNPISQPATLPVEVALPQAVTGGFTLMDAAGAPVPFTTRPYQGSSLLEFMANKLPSLGYTTYFFKYEGTNSTAAGSADLQIENEYLALFVDPDSGAIARIEDKRSGQRLGGGPLNEILLLDEDESQNGEGRELWTSSPSAAPPAPARITSEHTAYRETIVSSIALQGGTLERRYTLRSGQPWADCETRLIGVDLRGRAAFASFAPPHVARSLVFGERLGAITGARGQSDDRLQTKMADNIAGTVAYPAHNWAALTPSDAIQVGPEGVVPWEPAIIVHGEDTILEKAARDLQAALIGRGIPSILHRDTPAKPDFLWTDATTETDSNDYLPSGYRMRIVLGSPDQNTFCRGLLAQLPAASVTEFVERIPQGARVFLHDTKVPEGRDPVPTLLLSGLTPAQSASLADSLTDAVKTGRRYLLPPSAYAAGTPPGEPGGGCALLFPGSMSVSQQHDGRLLLGLAHRAGLEDSSSGARLSALLDEALFTYAIHPFEGTWRAADVPAQAEMAFAQARVAITGIHPGGLPPTRSFFGVSQPGLRLGGFKPAGLPQATNTRDPFHPRNGFTLFAWETRGEPWSGEITGALSLLEARLTDVFDAALDPLAATGTTIPFSASGFAFQPLWLLPAITSELDGLGVLGPAADPHGPIETRYWDEHRGAAPLQHMPLGVLLRGSLDSKAPVVDAVISNHLGDKTIEGTARLSGSSGMSFGPQQFPFSLPPGRQHVEAIQLAYTADAGTDLGLVLEAGYERQTYRDVLMTNEAPYAMVLSRNGAQLRVEIRNESTIHGEGHIDIMVSPALWTEWGDHPPVTILPRRAAVSIPPFKSQSIIFTVSEPRTLPEACVKLAANGTVQYQFFPRENETLPAEAPAADAPAPPPPRRR